MDRTDLEAAVAVLGELLAERGYSISLAVIGGGNLLLQGLITRGTTKDLDVVGKVEDGHVTSIQHPPAELVEAIRDVARAMQLPDDWVDLRSGDLLTFGLPAGFTDRLTLRHYGGLHLAMASRFDSICLKVYAAVDSWPNKGSRHISDLRDLRPTTEELEVAAAWCTTHDPSPGFAENLARTVAWIRDQDDRR